MVEVGNVKDVACACVGCGWGADGLQETRVLLVVRSLVAHAIVVLEAMNELTYPRAHCLGHCHRADTLGDSVLHDGFVFAVVAQRHEL